MRRDGRLDPALAAEQALVGITVPPAVPDSDSDDFWRDILPAHLIESKTSDLAPSLSSDITPSGSSGSASNNALLLVSCESSDLALSGSKSSASNVAPFQLNRHVEVIAEQPARTISSASSCVADVGQNVADASASASLGVDRIVPSDHVTGLGVGNRRRDVSHAPLGSAEFALMREERFWWHSLVHAEVRARVHRATDIFWRIPEKHASVIEHCLALISRLDVCYYIGITEQLCLRWDCHAQNGYVAMYVVWVSTTSRETARLEQDLLFRVGQSSRCENASKGGERASQGSPHYVYIVVKPNNLMRRNFGGRNSGRWSMDDCPMNTLYGPHWERRLLNRG